MTTQQVTFCTSEYSVSCQGVYPRPLIFCVPPVRTASGFSFLEGTLKGITHSSKCGATCIYQYTIEYDDEDLADPSTPLTSAEVSGFFCENCFTTWIEEIVAQATELIGWETDGSGNFNQIAGFTGAIQFDADQGEIHSNADTKAVGIGGGAGFTQAEGAYTIWHGISHPTFPGQVHTYLADTVGSFYGIYFPQVSSAWAILDSTGTPIWGIDGSGILSQGLAGSDIVFNQDTGVIRHNTSDGFDTHIQLIASGGTIGADRGAWVAYHGNEHATPGQLQMFSGDAASGNVLIGVGLSTGFLAVVNRFGTPRWKFINNTGNIEGDASNGGDFVFNKTGSSIRAGTSDGADNLILYLCSGGANNETRGAYIQLSGNESANAGDLNLFTGDAAGSDMNFRLHALAGVSAATFRNNTGPMWAFISGGALNGCLYQDSAGSDIVFSQSQGTIRQSTSDGSDSRSVGMTGGGGSFSTSRGAYCLVRGNEFVGQEGTAFLISGQGIAGNVLLGIGFSSGYCGIGDDSGNLRWKFQRTGGNLEQDTTNGGSITLTKASTCVVPGTTGAAISAAGSIITDATDLTAVFNNVTTVGANTGVQLWDAPLHSMILVRNAGANILRVYPEAAGSQINGGGAGVAAQVATGTLNLFWRTGATDWIAVEFAVAAA